MISVVTALRVLGLAPGCALNPAAIAPPNCAPACASSCPGAAGPP